MIVSGFLVILFGIVIVSLFTGALSMALKALSVAGVCLADILGLL